MGGCEKLHFGLISTSLKTHASWANPSYLDNANIKYIFQSQIAIIFWVVYSFLPINLSTSLEKTTHST